MRWEMYRLLGLAMKAGTLFFCANKLRLQKKVTCIKERKIKTIQLSSHLHNIHFIVKFRI